MVARSSFNVAQPQLRYQAPRMLANATPPSSTQQALGALSRRGAATTHPSNVSQNSQQVTAVLLKQKNLSRQH